MENTVRERASQLFGSLAHPTRLRIVELLCSGERTVNEVTAELQLSQSGASQHLAVLARGGVLAVDQRGTSRFYRVRGPRIGYILTLIEEFCNLHGLYGLPEGVEAPAEESPDANTAGAS